MQKKKLWIAFFLMLIIAYLMGPKPAMPEYNKDMPVINSEAGRLEEYITTEESKYKLKPDNHARIVWANDSTKNKTGFSIVYLHGFAASYAEGEPVHKNIAKEFGCNLYLSRLAEHGMDTSDALRRLTADKYWESAKEALAIGKQLGTRVILMGTSTGGTLALKLAAEYPDIAGLVLLSPNISVNDPFAWVLNNPWGLQIAKMVTGSKYVRSEDTRAVYKQYWYSQYRLEGAVALEELIETSMNENTFKKVTQPVLTLYYYKDKIHQDSVVKVASIKEMFNHLGTTGDKKRLVNVPTAGNHVMASYIKSNDLEAVTAEIRKFMVEVMGISKSN